MRRHDRVPRPCPIEGGHGTQSLDDGLTVSGTQWDTVGHSREDLRRELDRRLSEQIEEASKRRLETKRTRAQFARNRRYGLAKRHAIKEERTR